MIYTIQPGDSLWSIAARFGVSIQALMSANPGIHPGLLSPGQTITIPRVPSHGPAASPSASSSAALQEQVSSLEQKVGQLEEIVDYHRRQIADLQRRVGTIEQRLR